MIKFFRQIRFNLMEQNKTARYFKYAIGEIVLVVIGILIALSINNWNEGRKGRILELQYLEGIKTDLESDLPHIENRLRAILRKLSIMRKIDTIYINTGSIETHDVSLDALREFMHQGQFGLNSFDFLLLLDNK